MTKRTYGLSGLVEVLPIINPTLDRVLLSPVTIQTSLASVQAQVVCYEVQKTGPEVKHLKPGMHCLHISAAGDGVDHGLVIVREEDIIAYWDSEK